MTHSKKGTFLENYPKFCQVRETCAAIGLGKSTFYRWLKEDCDFQDKWDVLKKEIDQELLERHEKNIDDIASYTQKVNVGNVIIQLNIPDYDDSIEGEYKEIEGGVKELDELR
jgi:myo-inositol-1-phosphate synthase